VESCSCGAESGGDIRMLHSALLYSIAFIVPVPMVSIILMPCIRLDMRAIRVDGLVSCACHDLQPAALCPATHFWARVVSLCSRGCTETSTVCFNLSAKIHLRPHFSSFLWCTHVRHQLLIHLLLVERSPIAIRSSTSAQICAVATSIRDGLSDK